MQDNSEALAATHIKRKKLKYHNLSEFKLIYFEKTHLLKLSNFQSSFLNVKVDGKLKNSKKFED